MKLVKDGKVQSNVGVRGKELADQLRFVSREILNNHMNLLPRGWLAAIAIKNATKAQSVPSISRCMLGSRRAVPLSHLA